MSGIAKEFRNFSNRTNLLLLIDHSGRAGNGFFMTTFDNHPEVLSCPLMHYMYSYANALFGRKKTISSSQVIRKWTEEYYFFHLYHETNPKTENFIRKVGGDPSAPIDRALLRQIFDKLILSEKTTDRKKLILATYFSYAKAIGKPVQSIRFVVVSDSISLRKEDIFDGFSGEIVDDAHEDFSSPVCIHMIRDPRAGFASSKHQYLNEAGNMYGFNLKKCFTSFQNILRDDVGLSNKHTFIFGLWLLYFRQTFVAVEKQKAKYSSSFILLKNEDLNLNFKATLKSLCERIGLNYFNQWDDAPFVPTILGRPWKGTGAYNNRYQTNQHGPLRNDPDKVSGTNTGPNRYVTERWKSRLSSREKLVLDYFLSEEIQFYEYPFVKHSPKEKSFSRQKWQLLFPLRGEIPHLKWVFNHPHGIAEILNRLSYYFALPLLYLTSRYKFLLDEKHVSLFSKPKYFLS
jgi:hypothetical protein